MINDFFQRRIDEIDIYREQKRIGKKYIVNYSMFDPTYMLSHFDSKYTTFHYGSPGIYHKFSSLFTYISSYRTILEYQGNDIYKDLITGKLLCDSTSYDVSRAITYPICIDVKCCCESDLQVSELLYSKEQIERIRFYSELAWEKELSILYDIFQEPTIMKYLQEGIDSIKPTISSDYTSGPNDRLYYFYKDKIKLKPNVELAEMKNNSEELEKSRIGRKYAISYSDIYRTDKIGYGYRNKVSFKE